MYDILLLLKFIVVKYFTINILTYSLKYQCGFKDYCTY